MKFTRTKVFQEVCEKHGLTAEEIAEILYFPLEVVQGWFDGTRRVTSMDWIHIRGKYPNEFNGVLEEAVTKEIQRRRKKAS